MSGFCQTESPDNDVVQVGNGVSAPVLVSKVEPEFTDQARLSHIQGTVVLGAVVDVTGGATDITVMSPLGFGLDEAAIAAVERWRFKPATKAGLNVRVWATVEVNFRFKDMPFDNEQERLRTSFNLALDALGKDSKSKARAIDTIGKLSRQGLPAAMFLESTWMEQGTLVPKDTEQALRLLVKSADRSCGPALYELGLRYMEGRGFAADPGKAMGMIRDASVLGSVGAQFDLGTRYEAGNGVERDIDRAQRSFRLCAQTGQAACQYRLANLLLTRADRRERDLVQAIAWLELASERGLPAAANRLSAERLALTPGQIRLVATVKPQLIHK